MPGPFGFIRKIRPEAKAAGSAPAKAYIHWEHAFGEWRLENHAWLKQLLLEYAEAQNAPPDAKWSSSGELRVEREETWSGRGPVGFSSRTSTEFLVRITCYSNTSMGDGKFGLVVESRLGQYGGSKRNLERLIATLRDRTGFEVKVG